MPKRWSSLFEDVVMIAVFAGIALVASTDEFIDFFEEGDEDPWYLWAGRYEGAWRFMGDSRELAEFTRGLEQIEFRIEDPAPGSWRGKRAPERADSFATASAGTGTCVVDGKEYAFRLRASAPVTSIEQLDTELLGTDWIQFDGPVPFMTKRSFGTRFGISLEAARKPEHDWLFLWFGRNADGSFRGLAYKRVE